MKTSKAAERGRSATRTKNSSGGGSRGRSRGSRSAGSRSRGGSSKSRSGSRGRRKGQFSLTSSWSDAELREKVRKFSTYEFDKETGVGSISITAKKILEDEMNVLIELFSRFTDIEHIKINRCYLVDEQALNLMKKMQLLVHLKTLDLSFNTLTTLTVQQCIKDFQYKKKKIDTLDFRSNPMLDENDGNLLFKAFYLSITKLNGIPISDIRYGTLPPSKQVMDTRIPKTIDPVDKMATPTAAAATTTTSQAGGNKSKRYVDTNKQPVESARVSKLDLCNSRLRVVESAIICNVLADVSSSYITEIYLANNLIDSKALSLLSSQLARHRTIMAIDLDNNPLTKGVNPEDETPDFKGIIRLVKDIVVSQKVRYINLANCNVPSEYLEKIDNSMAVNRSIVLKADHNFFNDYCNRRVRYGLPPKPRNKFANYESDFYNLDVIFSRYNRLPEVTVTVDGDGITIGKTVDVRVKDKGLV